MNLDVEIDGYYLDSQMSEVPKGVGGVFFVYECLHYAKSNEVILHRLFYIGKASEISSELTKLENQVRWQNALGYKKKLCYAFSRVPQKDRRRIQAAFVNKFKPLLNEKFTHLFPYGKTTISCEGDLGLIKSNFTLNRTA